jgi:hypothetical protein
MSNQPEPVTVYEEAIHTATMRGILATLHEGLAEMIEILESFERFAKGPPGSMQKAPPSIQETHAEIMASSAASKEAIAFCLDLLSQAISACESYADPILERSPYDELENELVIGFWGEMARAGLAIWNMARLLQNPALAPSGRQAALMVAMGEGRLDRIDPAAAKEIAALRSTLEREEQQQKKKPQSRPGHRRRRLH